MLIEITCKMRGWIQYYSISRMISFLKRLDTWLRSKIRQYIWKSWKKIKTRITNLKRLGLNQNDTRLAAYTRRGYWRTSHSKTLLYTLTNERLERLELMNLSKLFKVFKLLNRRIRIRTYGGVRGR